MIHDILAAVAASERSDSLRRVINLLFSFLFFLLMDIARRIEIFVNCFVGYFL